MLKRREFVTVAGAYAVAWSFPARAQQAPSRRIGVLLVGLSPKSKAVQHFRRGLRDAGYFEGATSSSNGATPGETMDGYRHSSMSSFGAILK